MSWIAKWFCPEILQELHVGQLLLLPIDVRLLQDLSLLSCQVSKLQNLKLAAQTSTQTAPLKTVPAAMSVAA